MNLGHEGINVINMSYGVRSTRGGRGDGLNVLRFMTAAATI